MPNLLALPSVGDVDEAILGLDDRGIAELLLWLVFKDQRGFPGLTVLAHGEVERAATFGGVVVDQQMSAVSERDGIGAGVWIWQIGERNLAPGFACIVGVDLKNFPLLGAANGLQFVAAEEENAWLDGSDLQSIVQQLGARPGLAEIGGALEINGPRARLRISLVARWAKNVAIGKLHGLVLDRAEDAFGQFLSRRPCFAAIGARFEFAPPRARRWTYLVEEHERRVFRLKQHGIPCGVTCAIGLLAVGRLDALGPFAIGKLARHPDAHVRVFLRRAAKPSRDKPCGRLGDGSGVYLRVGASVVDVFGGEYGGISSDPLPGSEFIVAIELPPDDGIGLATIGSRQLELVVDPRDDLLLGGVDALQREFGVVGFDRELRCIQHFGVSVGRLAESTCERRLLAV